ncbi:hypothetical protein RSAG8_10833, partial [Rhizoctonia solani AG-8 WAC10335]
MVGKIAKDGGTECKLSICTETLKMLVSPRLAQFWEEAFNLEFEPGDEAFNLFADANADEGKEEPEGDESDNDGDSLIDAL